MNVVFGGLPGHRSPAVGPEAPFEMLEACHERVLRSVQLLERLQTYLMATGLDASAVQATQDVLRYFSLAAPLHHEDEELHVFPPLLALQDPALTTAVQQLIADHRAMEVAWVGAAAVLQFLVDTPIKAPTNVLAGAKGWWTLDATQTAILQNFAALHGPHMELEEKLVYPRARALLQAADLHAMSTDMVHRRVST